MAAKLSKLNELINTANYAKAEFFLYDLIQKNPNDYNLNKNLGMVLLAQKKYQGALKSFEKCYFSNNADTDILLNLSFLFMKVQDHAQCIKFSKEAINIDPKLAGVFQNLATCYLEMHQFDQALIYAEKALEIRGGLNSEEFLKYDDFINLYSDILLAKKEINQFIKFCESVLDAGIFSPELFIKLLRQDFQKIKKEYLEVVENIINKPNQFLNDVDKNAKQASANICLAEYYKTNNTKSEKYFFKANDHIIKMQRAPIYARQQMYLNLINYFKAFDDQPVVKKIDKQKGEGLIFIVGMPRSGTTLTESILSTGEDIVAGGEKVFFTNNLWSIFSELKPDQKINPEFIEELGNRYINTIECHRNGAFNFIDKMPANFLYYKFIKMALPSSKFIHVHRNSWDNAISLFKANYQDTIIYSSSFFGIATEYSNYFHLMKFWEKLSGQSCFYNIAYEDLVSKTDEMIEKLWDYCDIKGKFSSEKRKSHYANTASQQQVSQDIYSTSLKKEGFAKYKDQFYTDLSQQDSFWQKLDLF